MSNPPRRLKINRNQSINGADHKTKVRPVPLRKLKDCRYCDKDHPLRKCIRFKRLTVQDRLQVVRKYGYCINCLAHSHFVKNCSSRDRCRMCLSEHHTLLHMSTHPTRLQKRKLSYQQRRNVHQHPRRNQQRNEAVLPVRQPQHFGPMDNTYPSIPNAANYPTIVVNVTSK